MEEPFGEIRQDDGGIRLLDPPGPSESEEDDGK